MTLVTSLICVKCGAEAPAPESAGVCPHCNDPSAVLEINYDMDAAARSMTPAALAARPLNHWRYRELLPVEPGPAADAWPVGFTPILDTPRLARWAGLSRLRIKDDTRNPTACFKDRASSVGVLHALSHNARRVACASTGNAASSLAGFAAIAGIPATIFVPARAPEPKIAQLLVFGADVRRVRGTYEQAYELCSALCRQHGWYNRNCAINPYLVEGKKTAGLEIAEQTARDLPGWVAVSVGDGCTAAGIAKGLIEMHALGFIDRVPRLLGVQAERVDPVARAFETGTPEVAPDADTFADSINVAVPRNWRKAVQRVRETNGVFVRVSDDEIAEAMRAAGSLAGVFAEPAAAASIAGIRRAVSAGIIEPDADAVAVVTGSGLKDIASAINICGKPTDTDPL